MEPQNPIVSRVGEGTAAEAVALGAASAAVLRGQDVKITSGYDAQTIGAYTEIVIWKSKELPD